MVALAKGDTFEHAGTVEALGGVGLGRSLRRLFIDHGTTPEGVAASLPFPVDPALFYRVDAGRQPLPADVAEAVAHALVKDFAGKPARVDVGTVNGAARLVTRARGEYVRRPLPPLPVSNPGQLFGEAYQPPELTPYRVPRPLGGSVQLWSFGFPDVAPTFAEIDRGGNAVPGALSGSVAYGFVGNAPVAYDGRLVWTAGPSLFGPAGQFWIQNLSTAPVGVNAYNNAATVPGGAPFPVWPFGLVYEPASQRLWFTDFENGRAFRVDPATLDADQAVNLTSGGNTYAGAGLVAVGGKLYAVGTYNLGGGAEDGRLFEIDPFTGTVLRVSSGASLGSAIGVDYDPASETFFVVGPSGPTYPSGSICAVPRASLAASVLSVVDLPSPAPPTSSGFLFVTVAYGSLWVSGSSSTFWSVDFSGHVRRWIQPDPFSSTFGQQPASDGQGFLWLPDGWDALYLVSPSDIGPELGACATLAAPAAGALVLREGVAPALVP